MSDEDNRRLFGACFTPHGHGHNYLLEVFVQGPIDPDTQLVINLKDLDRLLAKAVEPLDHHHLNFDVPEFQAKKKDSTQDLSALVPTTENIALYLRNRIQDLMKTLDPKFKLRKLRLNETDDLWVEVVIP